MIHENQASSAGDEPQADDGSAHVENIARVCHEVNRGYCEALGDKSQVPWNEAPSWQRESTIEGVKFHLDDPYVGPSASHDNWMKTRLDDGWMYGEVKNEQAKTHPCLIPFEALPVDQQAKDWIFRAIIRALM